MKLLPTGTRWKPLSPDLLAHVSMLGWEHIHVSQLFRWRKELCRVEEQSTETATTLVPVIVAETVPAVPAVQPEPPATSHPRRKRSDVTIELGRGRRVHVDSDIDTDALGRILDCVLGLR